MLRIEGWLKRTMQMPTSVDNRLSEVLLLLTAAALRLVWLDQPMWYDEGFTLDIVTRTDFFTGLRASDHPPLYFLLLKLWKMLSESEAWLRLLSVILGVGTVAVVMKWLEPHSRRAALLAGVVLAGQPLLVRYAQELRCYSLFMLLTAVAFYLADRICSRPDQKRLWLLLSGTLSAAIATHAIGVFLPLSISVVLFPAINRDSVRRWFINCCLVPTLVFGILFLAIIEGTKVAGNWWMPMPTLDVLIVSFKAAIGLANFNGDWSGDTLVSTALNLLLAFGSFTAFAVCVGTARLTTIAGRIAFAALVYLGQLYVVSWLILPVFWYRTAMPALIPLAAAFALAIGGLKRETSARFGTAILLAFGILQSGQWITKHGGRPYEDWEAVAAEIRVNWHENDRLVSFRRAVRAIIVEYADLSESDTVVGESANESETILQLATTAPRGQNIHVVFRYRTEKRKTEILSELAELARDHALQSRFVLSVFEPAENVVYAVLFAQRPIPGAPAN